MKGTPINIRKGRVTNISDPDEKGKVQVRLLPEMWEVEKDMLPWVRPFMNEGMSGNSYSIHLPEEGSFVWVFFLKERMFEDGYYITGQFIDGFLDFKSISERIGDAEGAETPIYPNVDFTLSRGGRIMYENTNTGEWGVLQKDGATIVCTAFGGVTLSNGNGNFILEQTGRVTINGNFTVEV